MRAENSTEIRGSNLSLFSMPTSAELETIPNRVAVPGIAIHASGAHTSFPRWPTSCHASRQGNSWRHRYSPRPHQPASPAPALAGSIRHVEHRHGWLARWLSNYRRERSSPVCAHHQRTDYRAKRQCSPGRRHIVALFRPCNRRNRLDHTWQRVSSGDSSDSWREVQRLVLTNPDGQFVSLDAAFLAP